VAGHPTSGPNHHLGSANPGYQPEFGVSTIPHYPMPMHPTMLPPSYETIVYPGGSEEGDKKEPPSYSPPSYEVAIGDALPNEQSTSATNDASGDTNVTIPSTNSDTATASVNNDPSGV